VPDHWAEQRTWADLGLKPFEADGDVLQLADRLPIDPAGLVQGGREPCPMLRCGHGDREAGGFSEALQEDSALHGV
jgi:hypothetical protein